MLNIESVNLMQLTIDLAKKNLAKNKIPVAAIIVDGQTNEILAKATNDNSPIGHAELKAIKKALKKLNTNRLDGCEMYVNLEPCPMCAYAISKCNIDTLYFGAEDIKGGGVINGPRILFSENMFKPNIISGLFEEESTKLLKSFFKAKR